MPPNFRRYLGKKKKLRTKRASISALVSLLQDQKSVVDRVRQETVSICENRSLQLGLAADADGQASSHNYSIFDSNIGEEIFSFDDEIVNSFAYRNALKRLASKTKATQQNAKPDEHHILDEPLIDLEGLSETHNGPRPMSTVTSNHHCLTPSKPFTHTARLSDTIMKDLESLLPSSVASPSQQRNERHADFASPSCDSESPNNTSANQSNKNRAVEKVVGQRVRARAYDETCMLNKPAFAAPLEHSRSTSITADTVEDFDKNATLKTAKRGEIFGAGCSDVTRSSMLSENESSSLQGEERQGAESFVEQAAPEEFHIASPSPRVLSLSGNHNSYHRSGARVDLRSTRDESEAPRDYATNRLPRRKERPIHGRQYYLTSKSEAPEDGGIRIPTPGGSLVVEYDITSPKTDGKYLTSTKKVTCNEVESSQKTKRNSHQRRHSATKGLFIASHTTTALKHHKREDSSSNHDTRSSLSRQKSRKKRVKDKSQDSRHGAYLIDNSKTRGDDEVRSKSLIEANLRWHESKLEKEELEALKLEQRKTKGGQTLELSHRGLRASPVTSADLAHRSSKDASNSHAFENPKSSRDQSP